MTRKEKKLPIYFLVDCSNAISGEPIEAVRQDIYALLSDLKSDPFCLETAYLSVITFDSTAQQVVPLTELLYFNLPELKTGGNSAVLGEALRVLKDCVRREVITPTANLRGDYKPVVFIFSSSPPTDKATVIREATEIRKLAENVIACVAGPYADTITLKQITNDVLMMNEVPAGDMARFFTFTDDTAPLDEEDIGVNSSVSLNKNLNSKGEVSMESYVRRLPVYLLLDCSGSMSGEPIEAVRQGINTLLSDLKSDPQALETAYLSVITFDSSAQQVVPLTELMSFNTPELHASGLTSMGGALRVLKDCVQRELLPNTEEHKGDWKPLVFLLTDGNPTDGEVLRSELQDMSSLHAANIIACAAGPYADTIVLKQITPNVLMMNSTSAGDMAAFFAWVSSSIGISSKSVSEKPGEAFTLPPPPQGFTVVP